MRDTNLSSVGELISDFIIMMMCDSDSNPGPTLAFISFHNGNQGKNKHSSDSNPNMHNGNQTKSKHSSTEIKRKTSTVQTLIPKMHNGSQLSFGPNCVTLNKMELRSRDEEATPGVQQATFTEHMKKTMITDIRPFRWSPGSGRGTGRPPIELRDEITYYRHTNQFARLLDTAYSWHGLSLNI